MAYALFYCSLAQGFGSLAEFAEHLSHSIDIAFPVIHGRYGEDGGIQVCPKKHHENYGFLIVCRFQNAVL